ncbi:MAG: hypothetical protein LBG83_02135 [Oscillospiraceae bacterium]|jgi:hypothetical protein|nr:hypothetical protein [Oscillospiraceae bacterium]
MATKTRTARRSLSGQICSVSMLKADAGHLRLFLLTRTLSHKTEHLSSRKSRQMFDAFAAYSPKISENALPTAVDTCHPAGHQFQ